MSTMRRTTPTESVAWIVVKMPTFPAGKAANTRRPKPRPLVAHKNERRIELTGNVKIDDETRHMTGEKATFFLDASKRIEHIEAEQKVVLIDTATSRKATGDKATYFVNRRMVYVFGNPATATAPNGTLTAQQIAIDLVRNKVEVVSPTSPTQGTYKPQP